MIINSKKSPVLQCFWDTFNAYTNKDIAFIKNVPPGNVFYTPSYSKLHVSIYITPKAVKTRGMHGTQGVTCE